jgi:dGTPase
MQFVNKINIMELQKRERPREEDLRGAFFRDTTAIIHSYPFRRLRHKTQVFFSPKNDHICTRIEHVMHVATVATTICKALKLDTDLAWAISMGHDLGHTPFGHSGEKIIEKMFADRGGFAHELYSLRVVDKLHKYGKGMNLTYAVRDGIVTHCGEKFEQFISPDHRVKDLSCITDRESYPATWEGAVVRMSDKIAYLGRDMEDAVRLNVISLEELPGTVVRVLGTRNSDIIDTLVRDCVATSTAEGQIGFSPRVYSALIDLKDFNYEHIYTSRALSRYTAFFERILTTLFLYLERIFKAYRFTFADYQREHTILAIRFGDYLSKMQSFYTAEGAGDDQIVIDYVAGMTDDYAIDCIEEIMVPKEFEHYDRELYTKLNL